MIPKKFMIAAATLSASALILTGCATDSGQNGGGDDDGWNAAVATHQVGTSYHSVGTALASMLSAETSAQATVQPFAGPNAWMPALDNGDIQFGLANAVDLNWAWTGGKGFPEPATNARLLLNGATQIFIGVVVPESAGIDWTSDLRGKSVASSYGGNAFVDAVVTAQLDSVGLDWNSVKPVPVADTTGGRDSIRNGQAVAAAAGTPTTPALVELNSAKAIKALPFGDLSPQDLSTGASDEAKRVLEEHVPGAHLEVIKAGTGVVENDVVAVAFDVQMISSTHVENERVAEVVEAIWNNYKQLWDSHALGKWEPENMVPTEFGMPYHEGAVEVFKDKIGRAHV